MKERKQASISVSLVPVVFLVISLFLATMVNNVWEIGWVDVHIPLLIAAFVAGALAIGVLGYTWNELEDGIIDIIKASMGAIIILMIVGIVIGTWLESGIVPSMIYYGLNILNPTIFLVIALLMSSIVSIATGSSWTTIATVGIALMGVGQGLGIPSPVIAGAIISGSYFGDKMSPLSDTTNLAPGIAGTTLFEHIRHMIYTTGPSYVIAIIFFLVLGFKYGSGEINQATIDSMTTSIANAFTIHPILLIAPVLVILMVIMKVPALPGLFIGALIGGVFALSIQGATILEVVDSMHYGFAVETGNEIVDSLVSGGGLDSMMWTISLIMCAMIFGGIMERTGMLESIARGILTMASRTGDLILATVLTCLAMNIIAGDQYLAIVIPGRMYKSEFAKRGLHPKNLSRTLEDSATLTSPLIPWNSCGAYIMGTLGIAPWAYVPYCILNIVNPVIAIIYGYTGITIEKVTIQNEVDENVEVSV